MSVREFATVSVGEALPPRTIHVDRATLVRYAGASLDRNPIHWDETFAKEVGLPDVIAHGMWTMGAAIGIVADWAGDAGAVLEYRTKFTKPVVVPREGGADIEVSAAVTALDADTRRATLEITVKAADVKVLGRCLAVVALA
ncbi:MULTISPECIES: MaoC/PaaZ C-terminal domain-containing protein [unclassified Janibacter]|uniref:MaoC/PaaZ C-terminal domain-containing protein n=1 Tax=unclassified Janibacter TaxID=2649294 RepID=UPI003D00E8E1